jgi:hypothetical protein
MQKIRLIIIFGLIVISFVSCKKEKTRSITPRLIEQEGYILTSEKINNGFFNNGLFYFFPLDKVNTEKPGPQFLQSIDSTGYGFSLYSSYYIRLINCMGMDIISYSIDDAQKDPWRLKIEYWKILPAKISLEYKSNLKSISEILTDSLIMADGSYKNFKYHYLGKASIKTIEILLRKDDDLSGNESMLPIRKYGIFGGNKK